MQVFFISCFINNVYIFKSKVYANATQTIYNLKDNIRTEIEAVDPVFLERVIIRMQML